MGRECPYCESVEIAEDEEGGLLRCRDCGRSSLPQVAAREREAPPKEESATRLARPRRRKSLGESNSRRRENHLAPGDVASWPAALFGFGATGLFYGLLYMLPASGFSVLLRIAAGCPM
jgi:hypothetical protein